ncbi:MAG: hypothetical protein QXI58_00755 [Candidatus Micrarchaeia archaeon]
MSKMNLFVYVLIILILIAGNTVVYFLIKAAFSPRFQKIIDDLNNYTTYTITINQRLNKLEEKQSQIEQKNKEQDKEIANINLMIKRIQKEIQILHQQIKKIKKVDTLSSTKKRIANLEARLDKLNKKIKSEGKI